MASCNINSLLSSGAAFQNLSEGQLRVAQIVLLVNWLAALNPSLEVTPTAILARGSDFQKLSEQDLRACAFQSLCNILGGT